VAGEEGLYLAEIGGAVFFRTKPMSGIVVVVDLVGMVASTQGLGEALGLLEAHVAVQLSVGEQDRGLESVETTKDRDLLETGFVPLRVAEALPPNLETGGDVADLFDFFQQTAPVEDAGKADGSAK